MGYKRRYKAQSSHEDENQPEIVEELKKRGYSVAENKDDIFVGKNGKNGWFEIKNPETALNKDGTFKKGAIKPGQQKLKDTWKGQYDIVTTAEQIIKIMDRL
jgi:hypothetical protein